MKYHKKLPEKKEKMTFEKSLKTSCFCQNDQSVQIIGSVIYVNKVHFLVYANDMQAAAAACEQRNFAIA